MGGEVCDQRRLWPARSTVSSDERVAAPYTSTGRAFMHWWTEVCLQFAGVVQVEVLQNVRYALFLAVCVRSFQ
jgi:hypothetical protein